MREKNSSNRNRQPFDDTPEERSLRADRVAVLSQTNFNLILDLLIAGMDIDDDEAIGYLIARATDFYSLLAQVTQQEGKIEKIMDNTERARECLALTFEYTRILEALLNMDEESATKLVNLRKKDTETHALDLLEAVIKHK